MSSRSYSDLCGVARALDVVGERWALLIVREVTYGPKRFADLQRGLPGISANVLSHRLGELERDGVLVREKLGPPVSSMVYNLTPRGLALRGVLVALGAWGSGLEPHASSAEVLSVDAFALALQTTANPGAGEGANATIRLRIDGDFLTILRSPQGVDVTRDASLPVDATLTASMAALQRLVFGEALLAGELESGSVTAEGDLERLASFLRGFRAVVPV